MTDWLEEFLRASDGTKTPRTSEVGNSEVAEEKSVQNFPLKGAEKTVKTDETALPNDVYLDDDDELFCGSESIPDEHVFMDGVSSVSSASPDHLDDELTKLTEPIQGDPLSNGLTEPTKLTKPLSNEHVALLRAAEDARPSDVSDDRWQIALRGLEAFLAAAMATKPCVSAGLATSFLASRRYGLASTCAALHC